MKPFITYALARFGLFLAAFGLVWLVGFNWLEWTSINVLWTMLIALVISAIVGVIVLRGLRERLAANVQERAERVSKRFEESRGAEDVD